MSTILHPSSRPERPALNLKALTGTCPGLQPHLIHLGLCERRVNNCCPEATKSSHFRRRVKGLIRPKKPA
jgi:hypothetical protein